MLQNTVQFFDDLLRERRFRHINTKVNGAEMIDGFDDIIHRDSFPRIDGVRFKDPSCLVFTEPTALYVVGVVGHPHLQFMVQAPLSYQPKQKRPVEEYLRLQGRFRHMFKPGNEWMIEEAQRNVDENWEKLLAKCQG